MIESDFELFEKLPEGYNANIRTHTKWNFRF